MFTPQNGSRPNAQHIMVMMTDGAANDVNAAATEVRLDPSPSFLCQCLQDKIIFQWIDWVTCGTTSQTMHVMKKILN